jgi:putative transcriptional regulator
MIHDRKLCLTRFLHANRFSLRLKTLWGSIMKRFRLKADGRIVELRDGREFPLAPEMMSSAPPGVRDLRRRAQLTQMEFAARLGVPVETIRNWEQGKRAPRGPARALLAVIAHSPDTVFAALSTEAVPA